ncbi:MAG: hypothetical protein U1F60_07840 [Planctomycetota bacterium]
MTRNPTLHAAALAALLSLAPSWCTAQQPAPPKPADPATVQLAEWPKLGDGDRKKIVGAIGQFTKSDKSLHAPAHKRLVELGDLAAPLVMLAVSDRTPEANPPLYAVLDELLQPRHAALMARETKKPQSELRRYLTLRLIRFRDPAQVPTLQELTKDKDEQTTFYASLGLLALQQKDALPATLAYTRSHWAEVTNLVAEVLPAARSTEAADWVLAAIGKGSAVEQMAGLRLLRYLLPKERAAELKPFLKASDHTVLREAINAARVVHGEDPIENLPVFQAVKHQQEWLKKL